MFAHLNQQCNNFKDPGVQAYGGDLFEAIRDEADDVFTDLPPPVPTRIVPQTQQQIQATQRGLPAVAPVVRAAVPMARYHQSDAPCFSASCVVQTRDSGAVLAGDLRKGDRVLTPAGDYAAVVCVVVSRCATGKAFFVEFPGGLRITPFHPVRDAATGGWCNPQDLHPVYEHDCDAVYNFVLEAGHVMVVDGVDCVTLAHNLADPAVTHAYLGTDRVLDDLKACPGWHDGRVTVDRMRRDPVTKLICGLEPVDGQLETELLG